MVIKNKICYPILGLSFLILLNPQPSFAQKDDLGYFYDDFYQEITSRSYLLSHKDTTIPFSLDSYLYQDATLIKKENYLSEIENPYYCQEKIKHLELCDLTRPLAAPHQFKRAGKIYLDKGKITKKLQDIAKKIDKEPENGKLKVDESGQAAIFTESKSGLKMDLEKSYQNIKENILTSADKAAIPLAVAVIEPDIHTQDINDFGIKELVAHGESNFAGSPKNRIHNINVALKKFDGILIKPGEEFSFTSILGPVDGENGYKEELVIKKNETVPEFGGGVCQVSTTVFRAALNGGLKITERHNHAYPVQYYAPQGTDATIYVPRPDLKFINNTPAYLLIQTRIEGNKLSINFYGTTDGRQVELEGPKVTERTPDGKMKTMLKQIVKDSSGNITQESIFKSFYDNPDNYHHDQVMNNKPDDWSKKQWEDYKRAHQKPQN